MASTTIPVTRQRRRRFPSDRIQRILGVAAATCLGLPSGPADDIDGEPPGARNTPICTGTCPLDLDPQAARNGGYTRVRQAPR